MDSEDDIQPLISYEAQTSTELLPELTVQFINTDPEYEQVVYGYKNSRWRTILVYILSTLSAGIPFLVFHWVPKWFLYATSIQCCFQEADQVLIVETYQKKCKSFYIHKILETNVADASGFLNEAFHDEFVNVKEPIDTADTLHTPLHLDDGSTLNVQKYRYFRHKKQNLIWDVSRGQWARLAGIESGATCAQLHARGGKAPSSERRLRMLNIYGLNEIKVPIKTVMTLILLEVFNPFYVFQIFTIGVWLAEPYYYYCIAVVLMSTFGVATSVIQTKKNQNNLRATVEAHASVQLWGGRCVDSRAVAPGDVVLLPPRGCVLHFDAALLTGSAVLNESMLTGESVPVTKTALLRIDKPFDLKEHASSILFCGTLVMQTRYYENEPVKALVLRTGYNTSKGQLVRSILYPVPADFKFDRDSYKFIIILAVIAVFGFAYTVALKVTSEPLDVWVHHYTSNSILCAVPADFKFNRDSYKFIIMTTPVAQRAKAYRGLTAGDIALKALDIITIVVPPALPAAITVGRLYAVSRLLRARISCLNTRAVNVSGSIDAVAFDKTGTLTEDGLDMWGVVPVSQASAPPRLGAPLRDPSALNDLHQLKIGMATCHSLTLLDGVLNGDPLDLKMFESTGWVLEEPAVPEPAKYEVLMPTVVRPTSSANINVDDVNLPLEVGIVQQHQFVSSLQRSSVVVRLLGETVARVYCKGAPEMIQKLSLPHTVPENLDSVLSSYAEEGYRVIALATRMMEISLKQIQTMTRDEVECELEFLGLVIMDNRLKPGTTDVIRELKEANIHVVMITGDNIHTAVSVAKECGILTSADRVVHLYAEPGEDGPVVYCQSSLHGVSVGRPSLLPYEWPRGGPSAAGPADPEAPGPRYKIVMNGDTWKVLREHYASVLPMVVERGAVFARMSSDQKQQLVIEYQALGYYVAMCGDGANDCGALRAAHVGVSLSERESSVAAPFTSHTAHIACVPRVLREGRAALATAFGVFKFMVAYSLTEFLSVAFLYYFDSNLTDFQFLYIDVALIVNFAFFFGMTEAYTGKLWKVPPLTSLLGLIPLFSLIGQLVLIAVAQYLCYYALTTFPWYVRHTYEGDEANECWENYAIYAVSMFQYIILAIVFSHGSPYRKSVITNKQLMISVLIMTGMCVYITVGPADWLASFLELRMPKDATLCYIIIIIAAIQFGIALFFERVVIEYMMERKQLVPKCLKEQRVSKTPHLSVKRQLTDMDYLDCNSTISFDREIANGT